jgi:hypothetical protein
MKYYFFVDNFRGFSDTCIPITDVNFLVGENSTGKTSILGLLKLLAGPRFFFDQAFDNEHMGFGGFTDMVSAHANDRSYFRIGFVWEELYGKKKTPIVTGCLLTFEEEEGLPKLSRCTICRGGTKISMRLGSDIYYREETCASLSSKAVVSSLRSQWAKEHSNNSGKYRKLVVPPSLGRNMPVLVALSFIMGGNRQRKKKDTSVFYPPEIDFPPELTWLAPIRTKAKRTYDQLTQELFSPEGTHTPYLIRRMLRSRSKSAAIKFRDFIEKVGKASGLFQDVRIRNFGRSATAPFELDIVLDGKAFNVSNVGYGVSQALPVLVEILARPHGTWFAIQQPEVHLHPRAQASLGDVFFEMAANDHKLFLVETHSDFMIDRFRMNYKRGLKYRPHSQILFFERQDKRNNVTALNIGDTGELPADQPESYRQFFVREQMNLLGI